MKKTIYMITTLIISIFVFLPFITVNAKEKLSGYVDPNSNNGIIGCIIILAISISVCMIVLNTIKRKSKYKIKY